MSRFSDLSYDDDVKLVTVGGGCFFSDIYDALWPNTIVGGEGTWGFVVGLWEEDTRSKLTSTVLESTTLSRFKSFSLMRGDGQRAF